MSISISSSLAPAAFATANAASNAQAARTVQQPTTNNSNDVVKLTVPQQVVQLNQQGLSVPEIASNLNLTVGIVNSYLGITSSSS